MANDPVLYESRERIAIITLNRPEALNAMNDAMIEGLHQAWRRFNESDDRCAVVRGAGERAFSAGLDLKAPAKEFWRGMPTVGIDVDKPTIAAIDGHCVGGGYVLMSMCDLAVATERATFGYPETKVGYSGGLGVGIAARVPHKIAMEFLLVGEPFSARRAYEVGMINQVVPVGQQLEAAMRYARILADSAPMVLRTMKAWVHETLIPKSPAEISARTRRLIMEMEQSEDRVEGQAAFREKRKPRFTGR